MSEILNLIFNVQSLILEQTDYNPISLPHYYLLSTYFMKTSFTLCNIETNNKDNFLVTESLNRLIAKK